MIDFDRYEYVVKPEKTAKNTVLKMLLIISYVLFVIAWFFFGLMLKIVVPLLAFIPITLWILIFATWRYTDVEYEYAVESGIITFSKIYGGKSRKKMLMFDIRDAEVILPLGDKGTRRVLDDFDPQQEFYFAAGENAEDSFLAICTDENDVRLAVSFTADPRLLKLLQLYKSAAMKKNSK